MFEVDSAARRIVGPARHVPAALGLRLLSVTVDQPEYWPNEAVHLKVLMPGRPGAKIVVEWNKRDATPTKLPAEALDEAGVAVVRVLDGEKRPLELGEYRVVARTEDGKLEGTATFSVVEGALGSLSFAYEFKQVTSIEALEASKGGWFLGNAAGAGQRWGNGLSFKNELRIDNKPFTGEVELASRCMLSGCNGVDAGPRQKVRVEKGAIATTLDIGGHSGPFQVEVIAPAGSLRYQFEGSSHVERDMVSVALGVGFEHRAGLAPYEGTVQVPGRSLYVERGTASPGDAFEVASVIATNGELPILIRKGLTGATVIVWAPSPDGTFAPRTIDIGAGGGLATGQTVRVPVPQPFALVTIGGFAGSDFVEGFAVAFAPSRLQVALAMPAAGAPLSTMTVSVDIRGDDGKPLAASGILEVYDNRVASRSPVTPLASAIGDSVRNVSNSLTAWVDPIELERRRVAAEKAAREAELHQKEAMKLMREEADDKPRGPNPVIAPAMIMMGAPPPPPGAPPGALSVAVDPEEEGEVVRKGERKVVFCGRVRTGPDGRATVQVTLPPQTGRVTLRFVAVDGLDHLATQASVDVTKRAFADAKLPNVFVPGAHLTLRVPVTNGTSEAVTVDIAGPGFAAPVRETVAPGTHELAVPWTGTAAGTVTVTLSTPSGKTIDRRELAVRDLAKQPVTWSRLEMGGATPIALAAGEVAVVYASPGLLLRGIVNNLVTTMYSWFGHAEALSAGVAVRATVLAAIRKGSLADDGLQQTLRVDLEKAVRDLQTVFLDAGSGLIRPWPGVEPNPLWSAWVARNLHAAARAIEGDKSLVTELSDTLKRCKTIAQTLDRSLGSKGLAPDALGGYDAGGQGIETVPVEVDGQVVWKVVTDDVVQRFVAEKLLPVLDPGEKNDALEYGKVFDTFRFLRAFERTGVLQYLTQTARGLWLAGPTRRAEFDRLFALITRGMIFTQEPGMIQGPALLGGVYSTPMALVRFLELLMLAGEGAPSTAAVEVRGPKGGRKVAFGARIEASAAQTLLAPSGSVVRIDRQGEVILTDAPKPPFATAILEHSHLSVGQESTLTIELAEDQDPLEYVAIVAVPTTTAIKQTEDILSDYTGQLIYGQQGTGASKLQVLSVPFRGSRTMRLWIEGLFPGRSPGFVAIRHLSNPLDACTVPIPDVTVE